MSSSVPRPRDREATAQAILDAARAILAEEGFQGLGVNAVARRAGCDKQLIYRYFSGVEGLVDALGETLAAELTDALSAPPHAFARYAEWAEWAALHLLDVLRRDPLLRGVVAAELASNSPLVQRLAQARARPMAAWLTRTRGVLAPPPGVDAPAVNALLIGAVQQVALAPGALAGLPLKTDADWTRARAALSALIRTIYRD